jgi:hypothetical protein
LFFDHSVRQVAPDLIGTTVIVDGVGGNRGRGAFRA